ncbi:ABC transporter substrate-binding protein [Catenulispora pinisilvae]|uniref:ABC transporter substrate-binding protein n=1 Tax=Catenulispora pinisilvae TaxID=2705253 RepID=UPI002B27667E|nr:sugar ABC transporter substrate-binding protein [Catenulispora pinisilvae]
MELDRTDHPTAVNSSISRRRALQLFGGAAAVVPAISALAACGSGGSGGGSASLSLIYLGDATQQKAFEQLFAAFNKTHPTIKIAARGIAAGDWATFASTVSTQIAGGKVPDIIDVATEGQGLLASKGLLEPLDPYIAKDQQVVDDYFGDADPKFKEMTTKYGSVGGKTYFIPGGYNPVLMYCNTDVFAKAGVDLPASDWTWDEFMQAGMRIKSKTGAFLLSLGYSFPFVDIMPWLLTNGASTLNADWNTSTLDSAAAVESATFVKSLLDSDLSPKPGGAFDAAAQMAKGKLATLGGGRWPTLDMRRLGLVDKVRIVNWPTKTQQGSPIGWDGWPILKASKNKDAAWTFLKWMMSKEASEFYAQIGGTNVPARESVADSPAFLSDAPQGTDLIAKAMSYGTAIPSPNQGALTQAAITKGWQAAITGTMPVADALSQANKTLSTLL